MKKYLLLFFVGLTATPFVCGMEQREAQAIKELLEKRAIEPVAEAFEQLKQIGRTANESLRQGLSNSFDTKIFEEGISLREEGIPLRLEIDEDTAKRLSQIKSDLNQVVIRDIRQAASAVEAVGQRFRKENNDPIFGQVLTQWLEKSHQTRFQRNDNQTFGQAVAQLLEETRQTLFREGQNDD